MRSLNPGPTGLSKEEFLRHWSEWGAERERQKWAEYWHSVELQVPLACREKILKTGVVLQRKVEHGRLIEAKAREYYHILLKLGMLSKGQMDDVQLIANIIKANFNTSPKHLATTCTAYNYYRQVNKIEEKLDIQIDRRRKLPILTPETTLKAAIPMPKQFKWQVFMRVLYECGPRPCETFILQKQDVNFDQELLRLGTGKGSGETVERELRISPLLTEQLRTLTRDKASEDCIFTKTIAKNKPIDYNDVYDIFRKIKQQLKQAGYNIKGFRPYVYRHAFATRLYHATKDLALVSRALGHRRIEDTMIYIHMLPDQPRRFDVESCGIQDKEAISRFIAEGWELALQTQTEVFFKRPRWVP
ncbi:MAG: tyrosine-type recombinase/integrase [Candidatus Bathyarchaeia archaeon]